MKNVILISIFCFLSCSLFSQPYYYGDGSEGSLLPCTTEIKTDQNRGIVDQIDIPNKSVVINAWMGSLAVNDRVLIVQMEGSNAGDYEVNLVSSIIGTSITFVGSFLFNYSANDIIQVIRIPQYESLRLNTGCNITCEEYNPTTGGGIICFFVNNRLIFNGGTINASGKGYPGGAGGSGGSSVSNTADVGFKGYGTTKTERDGKDAFDYNHGYRLNSWLLDVPNYEGGDGGAGGLPVPGNAGQNGQAGKTTNVSPNNFSKVLLGNGGSGGDGGISGEAGGHGGGGGKGAYDGTDGSAGADGYPGGNGGDGGNGGGAICIRAYEVVKACSNCVDIISNGENGTDGEDGYGSGVGGKGGDGGNGGNGACNVMGPGAPGTAGVNGDGSGGGEGGDGGNAGMILIEYCTGTLPTLSYSLMGGFQGEGGEGAEPNPDVALAGNWGALDLTNCVWRYQDYVRNTIDYECRCEDAFRHLSACTLSSGTRGYYYFTNGSTIHSFYTNSPQEKLKTQVTTTINGDNITSPKMTQVDIYHCDLDDVLGAGECEDCFDDIHNGNKPGYDDGTYSYFDPDYIFDKSMFHLKNPGINKYCDACKYFSGCLYAYCPEKGADGLNGQSGNGNSHYYSQQHSNYQTYRGSSSDIIETKFNNSQILVYPNPTKDFLSIEIYSSLTDAFIFELLTVSGKKVSSTKRNCSSFEKTDLSIDISDLKSGTYILVIKSKNERKEVTIIKN